MPPEWDVARRWRNWAFESAALDLALNQAGRALHEVLGREPRPVRFVNSLGLGEPPTFDADPRAGSSATRPALQARRHAGVDAGADRRGGRDAAPSRSSTSRASTGSRCGELPALLAMYERVIAAFPDALLEDAHDLPEVAELLAPEAHRISYDAPIHTVADIDATPLTPRALNIKPCRVGDLRSLLDVYAPARSAA